MITRILGTVVGAKVAERGGGIGPTGGALLGFAASTVVRRMSLPALAAIAAGGLLAMAVDRRQNAVGEDAAAD